MSATRSNVFVILGSAWLDPGRELCINSITLPNLGVIHVGGSSVGMHAPMNDESLLPGATLRVN